MKILNGINNTLYDLSWEIESYRILLVILYTNYNDGYGFDTREGYPY